jgi:hypothetical protein
MLFYGERSRARDPRHLWGDLEERLAAALAMPAGLFRHAALVDSLIEWGELLQGVADAASEVTGFDHASPEVTVLTARLIAIADAVLESFDSRRWQSIAALPALTQPSLPERVMLRKPEGYWHYAVYPETYVVAAREATDPVGSVIGIRSIGTSLAAMVAATVGTTAVASLRPRGEPYRRRIAADDSLAAHAMRDKKGVIAVVDEGPGLSGSSFMSVADWLEQHGVAEERIHFFPSHRGTPGPQAGDTVRRRWDGFTRHSKTFDEVFLETDTAAHRLTSWLGDAVGPLDGPLDDLSAGRWRATVHGREQDWPPAIPAMERRKYRGNAGGCQVLVKFAGLGQLGQRKLAAARALAAAGFTAEPLALIHGFIVETWLAAAAHCRIERVPRPQLIARIADYLAFRAVAFPAASEEGASLRELVDMTVFNTGRRLGQGLADRLAKQLAGLPDLEPGLKRCATDNRLQPFEWLVRPDGRLMKTDALDHAFGHDLVGCQDVAWDLAGAAVEFDLGSDERETLVRRVESMTGRSISRRLMGSLEPCYLALEIARLHFGLAMSGEQGDQRRLQAADRRYALKLHEWTSKHPIITDN